jgi:hypothetical protein
MTNSNDSAYPVHPDSVIAEVGFNKREEALLRFMCRFMSPDVYSGNDIAESHAKRIAEQASIFATAYFNELNK